MVWGLFLLNLCPCDARAYVCLCEKFESMNLTCMLTVQRQFGLDGRGGYSRQMERTMERAVARGLMAPAEFHCKRAEMMESLASGVDDGRTRTQGMLVHVCNTAEATQTHCCCRVYCRVSVGLDNSVIVSLPPYH